MKFGACATPAAIGAVLAHSVNLKGGRLRKGQVITQADVAALIDAGITEVTVARPQSDDLEENEAANRVSERLVSPGLYRCQAFTGRANIYADCAGLLEVDPDVVNAANAVDEAVTLATLPNLARVKAGQMTATVKIIPYAARETSVMKVCEILKAAQSLRLYPFLRRHADLILTEVPGIKASVIEKAETAVKTRLHALGIAIDTVQTVPHEIAAVAGAIETTRAEMVLIFGASATSDRADVAPAGLVAAGGEIERFGMPVDPGNLLFLGALGERPVIGLPGCARSPALNGADWVLERVAAKLPVSDDDIVKMGVGGLLKEIPTRPNPRSDRPKQSRAAKSAFRVEIIMLAAGRSSRMKGADKLLQRIDDEPLLRRSVRAALASRATRVQVVLPPDAPLRRAALDGLDVQVTEAADCAGGMGHSLAAGVIARDGEADAIIVALADMPDVSGADFDRLIGAYDPGEDRSIIRAITPSGTPGNPVLFGSRFFESLSELTGDKGARDVIRGAGDYLVNIPLEGDAAQTDLDTPEAWAAWLSRRGGA